MSLQPFYRILGCLRHQENARALSGAVGILPISRTTMSFEKIFDVFNIDIRHLAPTRSKLMFYGESDLEDTPCPPSTDFAAYCASLQPKIGLSTGMVEHLLSQFQDK